MTTLGVLFGGRPRFLGGGPDGLLAVDFVGVAGFGLGVFGTLGVLGGL